MYAPFWYAFSSIIKSYINNDVCFLTPYDIVSRQFDKGVMISFDDITDDNYAIDFSLIDIEEKLNRIWYN